MIARPFQVLTANSIALALHCAGDAYLIGALPYHSTRFSTWLIRLLLHPCSPPFTVGPPKSLTADGLRCEVTLLTQLQLIHHQTSRCLLPRFLSVAVRRASRLVLLPSIGWAARVFLAAKIPAQSVIGTCEFNTIMCTYTEGVVNGASNYLPLVIRTDTYFSTGRSFQIPFVASVSILVTSTC